MNSKFKIIIICILVILILMFSMQFAYKKIKTGNNIYKSNEDFIDNIFNISSYEANLEVTINSNKTTNKYIIKQYYLEPNYFKQIIEFPENIKNLETIYNGKELIIKNNNINIQKIYKDFKYINNNRLFLNLFVDNCKGNGYRIFEDREEINIKNNNNEILYIKKSTKLPIKLEILDDNNNQRIYIEYKEIKINNIKDNNIFAFIIKEIKKEV